MARGRLFCSRLLVLHSVLWCLLDGCVDDVEISNHSTLGLEEKEAGVKDESAQSRKSNELDRTDFLVRYEPWLRLLARLEIDNRFDGFAGKFSASDAVQQTMAEAWQGWERFRGENEAQRMAWLRAILGNQLGHLARTFKTKQRDVMREISIDASLSQSAERLKNLVPVDSDSPSPSQHAIATENQILLAKALERLPPDYREVIVLRNLEELSHEEVAQAMNRKPGAVRMLWVRALARLKIELDAISS